MSTYCSISLVINQNEDYYIDYKITEFDYPFKVDDDRTVWIKVDEDNYYQHKDGLTLGVNEANETVITYTLTGDLTQDEIMDVCTKLFYYQLGSVSESRINYVTTSEDMDFGDALMTSQINSHISNIDIIKVITVMSQASVYTCEL